MNDVSPRSARSKPTRQGKHASFAPISSGGTGSGSGSGRVSQNINNNDGSGHGSRSSTTGNATTVPSRSVQGHGQGFKPARGHGLGNARGQGLPDGFFLTEALNADDDDSLHDHSVMSGMNNNNNNYAGNNKGRNRGGVMNPRSTNRGTGGGVRGLAPPKTKTNPRGGPGLGLGRGAAGGAGLARARGQGLFGSDDPVLSRVRRRLEEGDTHTQWQTNTHIHTHAHSFSPSHTQTHLPLA